MDREKVIKGLECCGFMEGKGLVNCDNCPYDGKACFTRLKTDALALLKAQEPRLVVEDDFKNADEYGYLPAWCETPDDLYCECILIGALEEEGRRYWTSRPTDEQREAVKWE